MRVKRVNRYYCDFCGKGGCAAGHMKKHEIHCTLNPKRACRMCEALDLTPVKNVVALVPLLPKPKDHMVTHRDAYAGSWEAIEITDAANKALPEVREAVENCPACIMAVIRQAEIPVPCVTDFDYTREIKAFWEQANAEIDQSQV